MSYIIYSLRVARAPEQSGQPFQVNNSGMSNHKQKTHLIRSEALFHALSVTTNSVKWIVQNSLVGVVSAARALVIAKSGNYAGKVRGGKLVAIVGEGTRTVSERDDSFWDDRACIRWHDADGPNSPTSKVKQKILCDVWDRALASPPPHWRS